ncbi:MAG TPA: ABC transporter permease [Acidobacteriaceae bacterium]|jgi:predicted permease|nr:ABC transporter permease [Acidobacteriaceae bacterium]
MARLRQDLVHSVRRLAKMPGFVLAVVLSIGLGIGANATIFSMVSRFVLEPPPVRDPGRLMMLHMLHDGDACCNNFPYPQYQDVRDAAHSFSGVAAYYELLPASLGRAGEPARVWGQAATANYFDVAQVPMAMGRGFAAGEEKQQVIVLGYRLWQRQFGADPAIVGKTVRVSGKPFEVVGVAEPGFHGLDLILDPQFWVPLGNVEGLAPSIPSRASRENHWLAVIGRLQPGVTREQATAELHTLATNLAAAYPATDKGNGFLLDQAGSLPPRDRGTVLLFLGALSVVVLLVLGIACANVSNLLLAQAASRQREMAVRLALGATAKQLMRTMLMESTLLALAGGVVGMLLALGATSALGAFHFPAPVPLDLSVRVDWRVLLYTFLISVGAGLLFGLAPAWMAARPMLASALRGEDALARPGRRFTLRNVLVVSQIAMCMLLLCVTGLFLRSLEFAGNIDVGFRSRGLLMVSVDPRVHGYTPEQTNEFLQQARERIAGLPGVVSEAATDTLPLSGGHRSDDFAVEGRKSSEELPIVDEYMASAGYFETLGIPRIAGRDFAHEAATGEKVAVVNRLFAQKLFGDENPIGQRVMGGGATYTIIGMVGNLRSRTLGEETRPVLFRSLEQSTGSDPAFLGYTLVVRTAGDPGAMAPAVQTAIHTLDPAMAVFNVETMQEHLESALFLPRLAGTLFGIFGGLGLVLAGVGLYGVISYSVGRRMREIGIRIAVGAQRGAVERLIVRQGMVLTGIAVALGLGAAWMTARFCASFLYGIGIHDPVTFAGTPLFLSGVALVACLIPARRAVRMDPMAVLRRE